ncbi:MAG: response regulator [Acidobacteria bacterium]|nr:response regulator [Acidobacteriota bacterium]
MQNDYVEKILVVDDEPLIRFVFAEALRSWGHVPLEASTIAEALNLFTVEQPQAALLDIELPDGSGLDLLVQLKQRQPHLLVIVSSANLSVEDRITALSRGAYAFLEKPVHLHELQETLDRGLVTCRQQRAYTTEPVDSIANATEQRWALAQLRELATLLNHVQDAVLIRDLSDRVIFWNKGAERMYGWAAKEALGRNIRELLYPHDAAAFVEATRVTRDHGSWNAELRQFTKEGKEIFARCHWMLVRDDAGAPRSIFVINHKQSTD